MAASDWHWFRTVFWKDGVFATPPENWRDFHGKVTVELTGGYPSWEFKLPEQLHDLEKFHRGLKKAHQYGRKHQAERIRDAVFYA